MIESLTIQANRPKVLVDREAKPSIRKSDTQEQIDFFLQLRSHHMGLARAYDKEIERLKQK